MLRCLNFFFVVTLLHLEVDAVQWQSDVPLFTVLPGWADTQVCKQTCIVGTSVEGYYRGDDVWSRVDCQTSVCMCDHFDAALADVVSCVPALCTSTVDVPTATSFLYEFCSEIMGAGWVAPLSSSRVFTPTPQLGTDSPTVSTIFTTITPTPTVSTSFTTITPSGTLSTKREISNY